MLKGGGRHLPYHVDNWYNAIPAHDQTWSVQGGSGTTGHENPLTSVNEVINDRWGREDGCAVTDLAGVGSPLILATAQTQLIRTTPPAIPSRTLTKQPDERKKKGGISTLRSDQIWLVRGARTETHKEVNQPWY